MDSLMAPLPPTIATTDDEFQTVGSLSVSFITSSKCSNSSSSKDSLCNAVFHKGGLALKNSERGYFAA
ncbi:unnamed protein product [Lathyrus oleraceus]